MNELIIRRCFLAVFFSFAFLFMACKKDKDNTPIPPQTIVQNDTSAFTGKLTVRVYYNQTPVPANFNVFLYANRQDIVDNIYLYHVPTNNSGISYFGYINYGNYYVKAMGVISSTSYVSDIYVVQVRPRRDEWLNVSVHPAVTE